jgi:hypothetical protein
VNTYRTTSSMTGMHMKEWMSEVNIKITDICNEPEHEEKVRALGNERMVLEREMKRLMGLIK